MHTKLAFYHNTKYIASSSSSHSVKTLTATSYQPWPRFQQGHPLHQNCVQRRIAKHITTYSGMLTNQQLLSLSALCLGPHFKI